MTEERFVYCCDEGAYGDSLTYAGRYLLLGKDHSKSLIRVRADTSRTRWFPSHCFRDVPLPELVSWQFDDEPVEDNGFVEISLKLSDGSVRWTTLGTPAMLVESLEHRTHLSGCGFVWFSKINETLVGRELTEMQPEGGLLDERTFRILEPVDDEED